MTDVDAAIRKKKAELARVAEDVAVAGLVEKRLTKELTDLKLLALIERRLLSLHSWTFHYKEGYSLTCNEANDIVALMGTGLFKLPIANSDEYIYISSDNRVCINFETIKELTDFIARHHIDVNYDAVQCEYYDALRKYSELKTLATKFGFLRQDNNG